MIWGLHLGAISFEDINSSASALTSYGDMFNTASDPIFGLWEEDQRSYDYDLRSVNLFGLSVNRHRYRCARRNRYVLLQEYR